MQCYNFNLAFVVLRLIRHWLSIVNTKDRPTGVVSVPSEIGV